ncbi:hypothetical protein [Brevundimonas sp.]|jgi:hypothetical protein|uniref:hypothetical protein n=1 Tax=Brevundimonas sp. TaxID=1871086 RepID=UPI002E12FDF2|nr:hypothetical protein [Brevundimonas sp.]
MILLIAALLLAVQDPPTGEVIATAPPRPATGIPLPPSSRPEPPRSAIDQGSYEAVFGPSPLATPADDESRDVGDDLWDAFDEAVGAPAPRGRLAFGQHAEARPLPEEALSDPVPYAAQKCRPDVRPADEDVADCFDRIDRAVRDEQDRRAASQRPRVLCENTQSRSDDGRTSSTSGRCSVGTGDPTLLDDLLDFD